MRQAVHEYVKKKRGFYAADGSEVPEDDDSKSDDDSSDDDDSKSDDDAPADPPADVNSSAAAAPDAKADPAADLQGQYATAADPQAVKDAVTASKRQNLIAGLTDAAIKIATARGVANGMTPDNGSAGKSIREQGNQGIAVAQAARQNAIQGFLQKQAIQHQVAQNALLSQDAQTKHQAAQFLKDSNDPNSDTSKRAVEQYNSLWGDSVQGMSAVEIKNLAQQKEAKNKTDASEKNVQAKIDANAIAKQAAADAKAGGAEGKAKTTAEKAYTTASNLAEGGRGSPQNVQIAAKNQTAVKNAQHILSQAKIGPDGKPDYNSLNSTQVALLNSEIARIAQQGAPTEASQAHLDPGTFGESWAAFKQRVKGEPQGAQLGEFIEQNKNYLDGLGQVADDVMKDHRSKVYKGARGQFQAEQDQRWKEDHPEDFAAPKPPAAAPPAAPPQQGGPGMAIGAPAGPPVGDIHAEMIKRGLIHPDAPPPVVGDVPDRPNPGGR